MIIAVLSHDAAVATRTSGGRFQLIEDYHVEIAVDGWYCDLVIPAGFSTDFASVPRPLWVWAAPHGKHSLAALVHDYLYAVRQFTRRQSDEIFYRLLREVGVRASKAWAMWAGVRVGGWKRWKESD